MTEATPEFLTWVRVDGTYALAVPREVSLDEQRWLLERVVHALEALAQHGSTSAEESLVGTPLRPVEALRAEGIDVLTRDAFLDGFAPPEV